MPTLRNSSPLTRTLAAAAFATGLILLGWVVVSVVQAARFDREARADLAADLAMPATTIPAAAPPAVLATGAILGIVDVPRLGLSAVVVEGDDEDLLDVAVGHLPDTPLPWQPGNTALAGHRDGYFRPLKDITFGDHIRLHTRHGTFTYTVTRTSIVRPTDLSAIAPGEGKTLTLVTCYPFSFVGRAPMRFVIRATEE